MVTRREKVRAALGWTRRSLIPRILEFVHPKTSSLPRRGREYRRGRSRRLLHQEVCAPDVYARGAGRDRQLRRDVPTGGVSQAGAGEFGGRGRHEIEGGVPDRTARHGGRRSGEPLRERHRGAGGHAAIFPGLLRGGETGCGGGGGSGWRDWARVEEERVRADRRRDGGDAGAVRRRGVRSGGLHRGRGGARRAAHREGHPRGGCAARAAFDGAAHQRVFAGAQAAVRGGGAWAEDAAAGSGGDGGRCAAGDASQLPEADSRADGGGTVARGGAHHRRRNHGQYAAHAAQGVRGGDRDGVVEDPSAIRSAAADWRNSGRRLPAHLESRRGDDPGGARARGGEGGGRSEETGRDAVPHGQRGGAEARGSTRGVPVKRLGILISGRGSNFEAIAENVASGALGVLGVEIAVVISNRAEARGLEAAPARGMNAVCLPSKGLDREVYDRMLVAELHKHDVDLVCLAGFMRLLSAGI